MIADGAGRQVSVTKSGSGTWARGNNTYSGLTTILNTAGEIRILGKPSLSPNTKVVMEKNDQTLAVDGRRRQREPWK